ncbi:protein KTI12 homolog [Arctopsyche grandis]|uniref:protein KTI12 homolog n=1 Tax=Arctopsyche grandis TaxID=121162 RepID=UPI00406D786F
MPLIILSGIPSSGKTLRAKELTTHFEERGKKVVLVSEASAIADAGFSKNSFYQNSQQEKQVRGALKSQVISLLNHNDLIILDASNYIKGFRYELYCGSKASKTTQCTIFTIINIEEAWKFNESRINNDQSKIETTLDKFAVDNSAYTRETFDALVLRFEEPNSQTRWDSPLFTLQPKDEFNYDDLFKVLYEKKPPPPNMSTQNQPLSSTNFLYELDKVTQDISKQILDNKKINPHADMRFPSYPNSYLDVSSVQAIQPMPLNKLRRQFLTFAKMQYSNLDTVKIGSLFIQYLNTNLQQSDDI